MKAFIGHSFDEEDAQFVAKIIEFIESLGVQCIDAKKAKSGAVDAKIMELILDCEIFVGIFSRTEPVCLEKGRKWMCNPIKNADTYATSYWVIQESGFALGSKKQLILLKENGVRELPRLQGNLEYISFNRNNIEQIFTKMSQMISDIKGKSAGVSTEKPSEESKSLGVNKTDKEMERREEKSERPVTEIFRKLHIALFVDKNFREAQKIYHKELEALLGEQEKKEQWAWVLRISHALGDKWAFKELQNLVKENSDNPDVIIELAHRYKEMGEYRKAKDIFLELVDKYGSDDKNKRSQMVYCYIQSAWCLALDDDLNAAILLLKQLLSKSIFQENKSQIFEGMAEIFKEKGEIENFLVCGETALDADPSNTDLRFSIAYAYSNMNNDKMALLHYKKLTDTIRHASGQNNLGVSYGNLNLKGKAISCYFKAAKEKETLAMGNLAHLYAEGGFIDDANAQISQAYKLGGEGIDVNPRVGDAKQRLKDLAEKEDTKEKEILSMAEMQRKFWVNYSKSLYSDTILKPNDIEGEWQTPWGNVQISADKETNSFRIDSQIQMQVEENLFAMYLLGSATREGKQTYKNRSISVQGKIVNMSGKYKIQIDEKKEHVETIENVYKADGYMVINKNCNCIEIIEKIKDNEIKFVQWEKHLTGDTTNK